MDTNTTETEISTIRKSFLLTFHNHAPIRLWGDFDATKVAQKEANPYTHVEGAGKVLSDYEDGTLWDGNPQEGHHDICYYICRSGKRIYWASYNSGETYGGPYPRTTRTFLKDADAIKAYLIEHVGIDEWHRIGHRIDKNVIVDSDLL